MKKLWILIFSLFVSASMAQTQIPEGGFNNWTPSSLNNYYEPTGGWWTSLNSLSSLGAPVTVSRTTDVHSGSYAAKMETKQWGSFLISGLLGSGNFVMSSPYIMLGKPYTNLPSRFRGWYKYAPVNGDSAGVVALLTRFNTGTGKKDTIAKANQMFKNSISVYTEFNLDFEYKITGVNPDTIIMVLTSSADGGNFNGQAGSTLLIDDLSLEYSTGLQDVLMPEFLVNVYPSPAIKDVTMEFNTANPEQLHCKIYAVDGRLIKSFAPLKKNHRFDVSDWQQGSYILQAWMGNSLVSSAKFMVVH